MRAGRAQREAAEALEAKQAVEAQAADLQVESSRGRDCHHVQISTERAQRCIRA